ncbi:TPA: hypothetical protein ACF89K_002560 [Staphylococcus aureus]
MAVIYDVVEDSEIKISDIAMINLTYVVEKAELEMNKYKNMDLFSLHHMFLDDKGLLNLVFLEGIIKRSICIRANDLDTMSKPCTWLHLEEITKRLEKGLTS